MPVSGRVTQIVESGLNQSETPFHIMSTVQARAFPMKSQSEFRWCFRCCSSAGVPAVVSAASPTILAAPDPADTPDTPSPPCAAATTAVVLILV